MCSYVEKTGHYPFSIETFSDLDEASDEEDPITVLVQENAPVQNFMELVQNMRDATCLRLDLERARMQNED